MQELLRDMDKVMEKQQHEMEQMMTPWDHMGFGFMPELGPVMIKPHQQSK